MVTRQDAPLFLDYILQHDPDRRSIKFLLDDGPRFRVEENTARLLLELSEKDGLEDSAGYLFWPNHRCWLEIDFFWDERKYRTGLLFLGLNGSLSLGTAFFYCSVTRAVADAPTHYKCALDCDLARDANPFLLIDTGAALSGKVTEKALLVALFAKQIALAALALLSSPRHCIRRPIDFTRLNRRRQAKGKWPFHAYHEVRIRIEAPAATVGQANGKSRERALHWVRAHLRLRLGKVEFVHPHWRGNAELGIRRPAYVITP